VHGHHQLAILLGPEQLRLLHPPRQHVRRPVRGLHRPPAAQVDRPAVRHRSDGDEVLHRPALAQVSEERDQRTRQLQRPRRAGGFSVTNPRLIRPQELLLWVDRLDAEVLRRRVPLPLLSLGIQHGGIGHPISAIRCIGTRWYKSEQGVQRSGPSPDNRQNTCRVVYETVILSVCPFNEYIATRQPTAHTKPLRGALGTNPMRQTHLKANTNAATLQSSPSRREGRCERIRAGRRDTFSRR
jgi:hypothetical protein